MSPYYVYDNSLDIPFAVCKNLQFQKYNFDWLHENYIDVRL